MSAATLAAFIARCRILYRPHKHLPDAELLERFARQHDAAAFGQLLERYASLVWGVCRRILQSESDCEDAFQAVFLALVRRPDAVDPKQSLGAWLHTVAVRVAHRTRTRSRRQQPQSELSEPATRGDVADEVSSRELFRLVDEEIARLPASVRAPLILCCLEGRTRDEAAAALGCSVAAIKGRLERGRELLRRRLRKRGVELPAAFLVLGLTTERIRAALWTKTMQSALHTPAPAIVTLAEGGVSAAMASKYKLILAALFLVSSAAGVVGALVIKKPAEERTSPQTNAEATPPKKGMPQVRKDRHGDPLPDGAIARLGTVRWRHGIFVHALAYSPDGRIIVTAGTGRDLILWDAATGKELRVFPRHIQPRGVAFSPDGKIIADYQRAYQLWDAATGKMLRELNNPQARVNALTFAPYGKILATANSDGVVRLCDSASGEEKQRIDCGQGALGAIALTKDGKLLATGGSDGTIRLWDAVTYKRVRQIATPKKEFYSLVFSSDGKRLASGCEKDVPRLWDVATGREVRAFGDDKQGQVTAFALSPDGKLLVSGYLDGALRLWDTASGKEKRLWRAGWGRISSLAFSPDSKTLATAQLWDGGIRLWDVVTGRERHPSEDHHGLITWLCFAADKKTLISAGYDRTVVRWDVDTQTPRRQLSWTTNTFGGFALSSGGDILAAGSLETDEVWLWDVRTSKAVKLPGQPVKQADQMPAIAFSPDGRLVASGNSGESLIHVWDVRERKEVRQIKGYGSLNSSRFIGPRLLFLPDGKTLACGSLNIGGEVTLRLWDVASGEERHFSESQGVNIRLDAISPDGKVLATTKGPPGRQLGPVRLIDMTSGKELCRHEDQVAFGAVAFSPDGKLVASGGGNDDEHFLDVWEAATGRLIRRFKGHHSLVSAITFAADGLTVASAAGDSTILLWDITGRQTDGKLRSAALTPRQLDACWTALANEDAAKAYEAVWMLIAAAEQAVPFLEKHLSPTPRPDTKIVARLIADLDSDDFAVRQKAAEKLKKLGDSAASDLRKALDSKPSLEVRRRIQQLLDQSREWTAERLRAHRAIQALEHIGTPQAKSVLRRLGG